VKPYKRRSEGLDCLFPNLFVEGLATRDFEPALRFLVGESAPLSPSSISRLNKKFKDEYESWRKRDLSDLKIVYLWADGIYLKAGIADEKRCLLVIIGVDISGKKHLLALEEGFRESAESWYNVLIDLQKRGLNEPALALADRRIRILGGTAESVAANTRTTVLVTQNAEYFGQIAEIRAFGSGFEIARNLFGFKSGSGGKIGKAIAR
jgi:transposase-like protein